MLGGRPAPVLSERSEFSGASIFCFVFVANDKNEGAKNEVLNNSSKIRGRFWVKTPCLYFEKMERIKNQSQTCRRKKYNAA